MRSVIPTKRSQLYISPKKVEREFGSVHCFYILLSEELNFMICFAMVNIAFFWS